LLTECLQSLIRAVDRSQQVGLDDLLVLFKRRLVEVPDRTYTRVVYPDVDSAELLEGT
jgi:hypothetical protein